MLARLCWWFVALGCSGSLSELVPGDAVATAAASAPEAAGGGATPPPAPPAVTATVARLAQRLLLAENEPDPFSGEGATAAAPGRLAEIEAFVASHPEIVPVADAVVDHVQGRDATVEAAAAAVKQDLAAAPVELKVDRADWHAVVILTWAYNTSEDWAFFTDDISRSLDAVHIPHVEAAPFQRTVTVLRKGAPPEAVDLAPLADIPVVGYAVLQSGKPPVFVAHAMPGDVATEIGGILATAIPAVAER